MKWHPLFEKALQCLDTLKAFGIEPEWSFGGGTALMCHYKHRFSKDIDIFLKDPQLLTFLSPRLNDTSDNLVTGTYTEQSNFLKMELEEGEIDFIIAPSLTPEPYSQILLFDRTICIETPEEITMKKLFYRTTDLTIRDVFDAAIVIDDKQETMKELSFLLKGKEKQLVRRIEILQPLFNEHIKNIEILPEGKKYADIKSCFIVKRFLKELSLNNDKQR